MGSRSKTVKTTQTQEPPGYLREPYEFAANEAMRYARDPGLQDSIFASLDRQYGRAADLTKTRLDTEFAGGGRNLGASYPARSEELQTLAANIYDPSNLLQYDPTNMLINRIAALAPGGGYERRGTQPYFKTGLF